MVNKPLSTQTPYVFNSLEANQAVVNFAQDRINNKHISIGWPKQMTTLYKEAPNIFPGEAWVVQACPGEGKSVLRTWWANIVSQIALGVTTKKYGVLECVLEESVELARTRTMSSPVDFKSLANGDADMKELMEHMRLSSDDKNFYSGPSLSGGTIHPDALNFNGLRPYDLAEMVAKTNSETDTHIIGCVIDYIQLMMDNNSSDDMPKRVANSSRQLMSVIRNTLKCPTMICAQSDLKKVKDRANKIPGLADIQWSSQIAQDADIVWSLWMPALDVGFGKSLVINGYKVPVFSDMVIIKIDKWRNTGMRGKIFVACLGKPIGNLFEIDLQTLSRIDADQMAAERIMNYTDIPERYFS